MNELYLVLAGLGVGAVIGLTGVGGGSLMTPILIGVFHVPPHIAVGTDLLFAGVTKSVGSISLARHRITPWREVGWLSLGSLPAAGATLLVIAHLGPASEGMAKAITTLLGLALVMTALAALFKLRSELSICGVAVTQSRESPCVVQQRSPNRCRAMAFGAVIALLFPYLSARRVVAADLAYAVPLTLLAGAGHASMSSVHGSLLAWLLLGSLPGITLGNKALAWLPAHWAKAALSLVLLGVGTAMVAR
jgi:uncharacterized membrane protein YfcA